MGCNDDCTGRLSLKCFTYHLIKTDVNVFIMRLLRCQLRLQKKIVLVRKGLNNIGINLGENQLLSQVDL